MAADKGTLKRLEARGMDGISNELGLTAMSSLMVADRSSSVTAVSARCAVQADTAR
jgi:hypothetical protein|eukprot:SAG25_NODE_53_length_18703_cov_126.779104_18_plen_56_part_00